ncbi:FtsX-like permease family protein [Streptomyces sp. NPDC004111]|uniref:FtsX-like permease family protein n=1 Tax=Streptomyces sp. NPDC004111 TaxID=3364690 RepID=UPI00367EF6D8
MSTRAVAPWVRTRLRTAPGAAGALFALVLVTSFLAAAFPRALERYEDQGLRHQVSASSTSQRIVQVGAQPDPEGDVVREVSPRRMRAAMDAVLGAPAKPLVPKPGDFAYGVRVPRPLAATDRWLTWLEKATPPRFALTARSDLAAHSRFVAGRAPADGAARPVRGAGPAETVAVEAAVSAVTARTLGIKVGSVLHLGAENVGRTAGNSAEVEVVGIFEPHGTGDGYWSVDPVLHTPVRLAMDREELEPYWSSTLLLAPGEAAALFTVTPAPEMYWEFSPRTDHLRASDAEPLAAAVASLEGGPALSALRSGVSPGAAVVTDLEKVVGAHLAARSAIVPVVAVAAFGVGTVAAVVLLMAGGLTGARRHAELALVRARGGSVRGLAGRLCAELAVVAVPAAALGALAAFLLLPDAAATAPVLAAGAVALLACAGLPVRAAFAHLRPRVHGERADLVRAKPSRRRTVLELTLLALTVAAVTALRGRGTEGPVDQLVSAAPVLVGIIASLVLIRLYPLPLRLAARPMALRRGAIGFLSAARAGRSPATATLPLLALLLALTTAAFGGSVLAGVADTRDRAATAEVGGDARLDQMQKSKYGFEARTVEAVRKLPGVREVSAVGIDYLLSLPDGKRDVALVTVDPQAYARLSRATGTGGFEAGALARQGAGSGSGSSSGSGSGSGSGGKGGVFPVLASPEVAQRLGDAPGIALRSTRYGAFTTRVAGVLASTPALREGDFLVVSAAAFPAHKPASLLVTGTDDGRGLQRAALQKAAGSTASVHLRAEARAEFVSPPFQRGAERIYTAAVAAGAGFAVLAVLLSLLQAAPERVALLARLRTMGITRGQGRKLLVLESLPQALMAAFGGVLAGWATVRLLAPDIDLGTLALAANAPTARAAALGLVTDWWSLLVPALAVVCLAAGVAAIQAWWSTRVTTTELRAGDAR